MEDYLHCERLKLLENYLFTQQPANISIKGLMPDLKGKASPHNLYAILLQRGFSMHVYKNIIYILPDSGADSIKKNSGSTLFSQATPEFFAINVSGSSFVYQRSVPTNRLTSMQ